MADPVVVAEGLGFGHNDEYRGRRLHTF
jgi:hypothetical protein